MRALLQRVSRAQVTVEGRVTGHIERGFLVLLGVGKADDEAVAASLAKKAAELRIFEDDAGRMNRSVMDVGGACLVVSQFTLYADCRKGRRPYFGDAGEPGRASELCDAFASSLGVMGLEVQTGEFGAMMQVELCNDGPVTIWLDSDA